MSDALHLKWNPFAETGSYLVLDNDCQMRAWNTDEIEGSYVMWIIERVNAISPNLHIIWLEFWLKTLLKDFKFRFHSSTESLLEYLRALNVFWHFSHYLNLHEIFMYKEESFSFKKISPCDILDREDSILDHLLSLSTLYFTLQSVATLVLFVILWSIFRRFKHFYESLLILDNQADVMCPLQLIDKLWSCALSCAESRALRGPHWSHNRNGRFHGFVIHVVVYLVRVNLVDEDWLQVVPILEYLEKMSDEVMHSWAEKLMLRAEMRLP